MAVKKPNILCIMSDEHTWNIAGCYGNPLVKTPNLDRLAKHGVLFTDCYTPSPLCVPARLAFTAGQYISKCKGWDNNSELPSADYPSLFGLLNKDGYECALGGKMHYGSDRRYGFTKDLNPGFNKDFKSLIRHKRIDVDSEEYAKMKDGLSRRFSQFEISENNPHFNHDLKVTDLCGEYLRNRKKDDKPFFLLAGYIAPHFPIIAPEKYYEMYKDRVPMPVIPEGFLDSIPLNYKVLRRAFQTENVPAEIVKKGRELYYAYVTWMDNEIGKLLEALYNSESADNTVIIYTTDHGENLGEHGMWWKNNMYDSCSRIPLIVNFPDRYKAGTRINKVCSMLDLVPTIAEICGLETRDVWDGDSLMGLMEGTAGWKDFAVSEYYAHNIAAGHCMIRRGKYKYVYFNSIGGKYPAEKQLFDLEADPGEFKNLAGDTKYSGLIAELHNLLVKELGREPEAIEAEVRSGNDFDNLTVS